jgi:DNA-binding MarR family transcriptional regulator
MVRHPTPPGFDSLVDINTNDPMSKSDTLSLARTHHIRDTCLCLHVQRAARIVARRFDDALRPYGLTNGQFSLLTALNRPVPAPMSAVANLLALDRTTLTANLKPLERRLLVKVAVDPNDRRGRVVTLTSKGRKLLVEAFPAWRETHEALEPMLRGADRFRADLLALS